MLLCAISDRGEFSSEQLVSRSIEVIRGGVDFFQLREKKLPDREILDLLDRLVPDAYSQGVRLLVNGRPDLAVISGAAGVHLPSNGLPTARVRKSYPQPLAIGRSCHSVEEVAKAESDGADFVTFGPVFDTPSKVSYGEPLGTEALSSACRRAKIPVLALGGVSADRVGEVIAAGAAGVAAIRLFWDMEYPEGEIPRLRQHHEKVSYRVRK